MTSFTGTPEINDAIKSINRYLDPVRKEDPALRNTVLLYLPEEIT